MGSQSILISITTTAAAAAAAAIVVVVARTTKATRDHSFIVCVVVFIMHIDWTEKQQHSTVTAVAVATTTTIMFVHGPCLLYFPRG